MKLILGGRKLVNQIQIDNYLHETKSKLTIELFVLDTKVNMKQHYCPDGVILNSDISNGQENVPISVVNEIDKEPAKIEEPSLFTYRVERTPVTGVNMVINEPTMTCCTCTDGCRNRTKCACKLN
jgi:histone-lysine N-methyltransferase SETDB1